MTMPTADVLRPGGIKGRITAWFLATVVPPGLRLLRRLPRNIRMGKLAVVTRYDEVREVYLNDADFGVPYKEKLDVITGGQPFFLGMDDTPDYRRDTSAMRKVVLRDDIPSRLAPNTLTIGEDYVKQAGGRIEVVDYVRRLTFKLYQDYFGIPDPPGGTLPVWATRLFEFQFADGGNDKALRAEVDDIGPKLRAHIDGLIAQQKSAGQPSDDVLGRCVVMAGKNEPGFSDLQIRTALMGFIVGGPPQPPMVVPQALEQLLRRPDALAGACEAARASDDKLLAAYVFEAMRFDPLAPFMPRVARNDAVIAEGTGREIQIPKGTSVMVAFSSAMMDERRLRAPKTFDPGRLPNEYIHFGYGLHQCFGIYMNQALLPLMLKPLLKRRNLRRAPGAEGKLRKNGVFAERLWVEYDV